jgi:hypothetical protein
VDDANAGNANAKPFAGIGAAFFERDRALRASWGCGGAVGGIFFGWRRIKQVSVAMRSSTNERLDVMFAG